MPEVTLKKDKVEIIELLVKDLGFCKSTSEARRLIEQGAVKVNDEVIHDIKANIQIQTGLVVKVGKKKIVRIKKEA